MFRSTTDQMNGLGWKDAGHTFSSLLVDPDGACVAAERGGGRELDCKGMLVRYANPFKAESAPEILYETKKGPLIGATRGADGSLWAITSKDVHTNVSGKWKASKPTIDGYYLLSDIDRAGDTIWLRDSNRFHRLVDGKWQPVPTDPDWGSAYDMAGLAADDVYLTFYAGLAHFDGQSTTLLDDAPKLNRLQVAGDEIIAGAGIGNRKRGFRPPVEGASFDGAKVFPALGGLAAVSSKDVSFYRDGKGGPIMEATGWIANACAGNAEVLWIANRLELLCTDGSSWRTVPRALHDHTRKR